MSVSVATFISANVGVTCLGCLERCSYTSILVTIIQHSIQIHGVCSFKFVFKKSRKAMKILNLGEFGAMSKKFGSLSGEICGGGGGGAYI